MPYTPWKIKQDIVVFPGALGGGNWNGVTYNKKLGLMITNVMNAGQWGHLEEVKPGARRSGGDQPRLVGRRAAACTWRPPGGR